MIFSNNSVFNNILVSIFLKLFYRVCSSMSTPIKRIIDLTLSLVKKIVGRHMIYSSILYNIII